MGKQKHHHKYKQVPVPNRLPTSDKTPRLGVDDPDHVVDRMRPVWRIQSLDLEGPFGWNVHSAATLRDVHLKLGNFESMHWREIEQKPSCHFTAVDRLEKAAQDRLVELNLDDTDTLFQLRLDGKTRVWGIRDRFIFRILWWDPEHGVYKVEKKHT